MVCCLQMDMATSVTAHFSFLWDSILKFLSDKILVDTVHNIVYKCEKRQ